MLSHFPVIHWFSSTWFDQQFDWLLTVLRKYISEKLLPVLPLGVYKLSCHNSELRLLDPAAKKVVQQHKPEDLAALIELTPIDGSAEGAMRLKLFRMIAKNTTLAQCVAFLDELMGETSVRLQEKQAAALEDARPVLKSVMVSRLVCLFLANSETVHLHRCRPTDLPNHPTIGHCTSLHRRPCNAAGHGHRSARRRVVQGAAQDVQGALPGV